jgi:aldehyde:ferredoxin oxidoreductase
VVYGYAGKVLHVDLAGGTFEVEEPSEEFYRTYMGGSALGLYYALKHTPAGADPLGPENTLAITLSPTVGAPISGQSRATAVAKSPLTGAVGDSQAGGFWPAELKFAGFDALVFHGKAPSPVYLWVKDGEFELRDASHLWGHGYSTREVDEMLAGELDERRVQIAQVGEAGERLVRFAAIMNMANRAHGRTGMGAVMGSKNLKAIAVRGSKKRLAMADTERLRALMKRFQPNIQDDEDVAELAKYGTSGIVQGQEADGGLPTRNWTSGSMGAERAEAISGETLYDRVLRGAAEGTQFKTGRDTCYSCGVRCKRVVESEWNGRALVPEAGGPEYETLSVFGSYCDVDDLGALTYANQLCNDYGVDTISAGATMAFAIECFERGLLTADDTGGIQLGWGKAEPMIAMLEATLRREGFGDVLAEGSKRAAERIGNGAERYFMGVKGQELPAHMPQVKRSLALVYAVNPFGADHQSSEHDPMYEPEYFEIADTKYGNRFREIGLDDPQDVLALNPAKAEFALRTQYAYSALDTVDVCQFVYGPSWQLMGMGELAEMVSAVTGWEVSVDELMEVGRRRLNMLRAFNAREGITRDADTLPDRLFDEPLQGGASDGLSVDRDELVAALDAYFGMAGWDVGSGNPTPETLEGLGLGWVSQRATG